MRVSRLLNRFNNELRLRLIEKVVQTKIVVFLLPSEDLISGGILSVISMHRGLKRQEHKLGIQTFLSTHPQAPHFAGYTMHNQDINVYDFHQLIGKLLPNSTILFHIPESHVIKFCAGLRHAKLDRLKENKNLTYDINILNQNPDYFPVKSDLVPLIARIRNITQTTAHSASNKPFQLGKISIQSSYLGSWLYPEEFTVIPFEKKSNTIVVGHDDHPHKETILRGLRTALPDFQIIVVKNMKFKEYTELQKYCKFGISFGEGVDGYFVQCIQNGGIAFAVYNDTFFTEDIHMFPTVFDSYQQLGLNLASMIRELNSPEPYGKLSCDMRSVIEKYWTFQGFKKRLEHIHVNWLNNIGCVATEAIV